jgi:uncharacterized protein YndB with AHSA1/START domain
MRSGVLALLVALATPATAEVAASAPDGFTVRQVRTVGAAPAPAFAALLGWGRWWSGEHSYSGDAANTVLDPHAGGCLCERWAGGEVAHGRVLMILPPRVLRLDAPFGPLQALPGKAMLTFTLAPVAGGTRIAVEMRAAGLAADGYDRLAPSVDAVLAVQADRLARLIDTGRP